MSHLFFPPLCILSVTSRLFVYLSGRLCRFSLRTQFVCFASRFTSYHCASYSDCACSDSGVSCLGILLFCFCFLIHIESFLLPFQGIQLFSHRPLSPDNMMYCKLIIYRQLTLKKLFLLDHRKFVFLKTNTDVILSCKILNIELVVNS